MLDIYIAISIALIVAALLSMGIALKSRKEPSEVFPLCEIFLMLGFCLAMLICEYGVLNHMSIREIIIISLIVVLLWPLAMFLETFI